MCTHTHTHVGGGGERERERDHTTVLSRALSVRQEWPAVVFGIIYDSVNP